MRKLITTAALLLPLLGGPVAAQDTLKIGYIDPLSGGGASVGEIGLKIFQFLADERSSIWTLTLGLARIHSIFWPGMEKL